jgi:hypothetical protein
MSAMLFWGNYRVRIVKTWDNGGFRFWDTFVHVGFGTWEKTVGKIIFMFIDAKGYFSRL